MSVQEYEQKKAQRRRKAELDAMEKRHALIIDQIEKLEARAEALYAKYEALLLEEMN